jgi:membrane protein DedA with SNARE-associated domain
MRYLILTLASYSFFASFIAPIVSGEVGVIFLAFLSAHSPIHFSTVVIFSSLGLIFLDSLWFWAIRHPWVQSRVTFKIKGKDYYIKLEKKIENFSHHHDIFTLFISKILVGSRVLVLTYLILRKINFVKFFVYNTISTVMWAFTISLFGWFAGKGYYNFLRTYKEITSIMLAIIVAIGIFYLIMHFIRAWIIKKENAI